MEDIKITPEINYQIQLPEGTYYPALFDVFDLSGWVETLFYLPDENDNLVFKSRTINALNLDHLSFPEGEKKSPKIFIHRGLAELLGSCGFSHISNSLIKNASETRDIFSKYAGTVLFPDKNH
jgi:hypothetical protein